MTPSLPTPVVWSEPSPAIRAHFDSPSWALDIFKDPVNHPFLNPLRAYKPKSSESSLTLVTLNTPDTITAWQTFYRPSSPPKEPALVLTLVKIGSGLNGHIDIVHGGFISFLLDDITGQAADMERPDDKRTMTAYLKTDFKAPIPTPATLLGRSWVERKEGRKVWSRATVEDGHGKVYATGEALYIIVEPPKPREKL